MELMLGEVSDVHPLTDDQFCKIDGIAARDGDPILIVNEITTTFGLQHVNDFYQLLEIENFKKVILKIMRMIVEVYNMQCLSTSACDFIILKKNVNRLEKSAYEFVMLIYYSCFCWEDIQQIFPASGEEGRLCSKMHSGNTPPAAYYYTWSFNTLNKRFSLTINKKVNNSMRSFTVLLPGMHDRYNPLLKESMSHVLTSREFLIVIFNNRHTTKNMQNINLDLYIWVVNIQEITSIGFICVRNNVWSDVLVQSLYSGNSLFLRTGSGKSMLFVTFPTPGIVQENNETVQNRICKDALLSPGGFVLVALYARYSFPLTKQTYRQNSRDYIPQIEVYNTKNGTMLHSFKLPSTCQKPDNAEILCSLSFTIFQYGNFYCEKSYDLPLLFWMKSFNKKVIKQPLPNFFLSLIRFKKEREQTKIKIRALVARNKAIQEKELPPDLRQQDEQFEIVKKLRARLEFLRVTNRESECMAREKAKELEQLLRSTSESMIQYGKALEDLNTTFVKTNANVGDMKQLKDDTVQETLIKDKIVESEPVNCFLALDGDGKQSLFNMVLLQQIEEETGSSIAELFDTISGSGFSAILGLATACSPDGNGPLMCPLKFAHLIAGDANNLFGEQNPSAIHIGDQRYIQRFLAAVFQSMPLSDTRTQFILPCVLYSPGKRGSYDIVETFNIDSTDAKKYISNDIPVFEVSVRALQRSPQEAHAWASLKKNRKIVCASENYYDNSAMLLFDSMRSKELDQSALKKNMLLSLVSNITEKNTLTHETIKKALRGQNYVQLKPHDPDVWLFSSDREQILEIYRQEAEKACRGWENFLRRLQENKDRKHRLAFAGN